MDISLRVYNIHDASLASSTQPTPARIVAVRDTESDHRWGWLGHRYYSNGLFHLLKIHPHRRTTLGSPSRHQLILQKNPQDFN